MRTAKYDEVFAYGESGADAQDWTESGFLKQWTMGVRTYRHKMKLMLLSGGGNYFAGVPEFNNNPRAPDTLCQRG